MGLLYLAPPLLVADLVLVLKMYVHLCLARQGPYQSPSVRCGVLNRWPYITLYTVHGFGRFFYRIHQVPNKLVHNKFIFIVFAQFKSVIEENVNCERSKI